MWSSCTPEVQMNQEQCYTFPVTSCSRLDCHIWRKQTAQKAMLWKLGELKAKVTAVSLGVISFWSLAYEIWWLLPVWIVWLTRKCCCRSVISCVFCGKRSSWLSSGVEMFPACPELYLLQLLPADCYCASNTRVFLQLRNTRGKQNVYVIKCWVWL